ncbi:MAG TPA: hypothetical protein DCW35_10075 [Polynucleobacter sp.]|nr:hypothetical protein [Polynucleobacter sp.]
MLSHSFVSYFFIACFVHAPIGMANILQETFPNSGLAKPFSWALAICIFVLGTAAVIGVYTGSGL